MLDFYVGMTKAPPILGLQAYQKLGLIEKLDCPQEQPMTCLQAWASLTSTRSSSKKALSMSYKLDVVSYTGCKTVWRRNWTKWNMTESLVRLTNQWTESTKKDGSLRLCLDPKDLSSVIRQENFQIPSFEDVVSCLEGRNISQSWTKGTPTGNYPWVKRALTDAPLIILLADTASYVCHLEFAMYLRCCRGEYTKYMETCKE